MKKLTMLVIITSLMNQLNVDALSFNEEAFLAKPEKSCPSGLKGIYTPHCAIADTKESYLCQADRACGGSYWRSLRPCTFENDILNCMGSELNPRLCSTEKPITNCGGRLQCGNCNQTFTYPEGFEGPYKRYCHDCWVDQANNLFSCTCNNKIKQLTNYNQCKTGTIKFMGNFDVLDCNRVNYEGSFENSCYHCNLDQQNNRYICSCGRNQVTAVLMNPQQCTSGTITFDGNALNCTRGSYNKTEALQAIMSSQNYRCQNCKLIKGHIIHCDCPTKYSNNTKPSEVDLLSCPSVENGYVKLKNDEEQGQVMCTQ